MLDFEMPIRERPFLVDAIDRLGGLPVKAACLLGSTRFIENCEPNFRKGCAP